MTEDAVIVVPGLMGSALYDTVEERTIWGLEPGWYVRAWSPIGTALKPLAVTGTEREGRAHRVEPRSLRFPAFAPGLGGLAPYQRLLQCLRTAVKHPEAVREFPYDWRLSVAYNAGLLAEKIDRHLTWWRAESGNPGARVVLVGHSMGGLICQHLHTIPGAADSVRNVVTLATPFGGAAKVAEVLGAGTGSPIPLPAQRLRRVAVTMPGLYDLLPTYRCVVTGNRLNPLTAGDIAGFGADTELAGTALRGRMAAREQPMNGHRALIGVDQPTVCSLSLADGIAKGLFQTYEPDRDGTVNTNTVLPGLGDGTVPRNASLPARSTTPMPAALQHLPLARADVAMTFARDVVLHGRADDGPRLGPGDGIGLRLPDIVQPRQEWVAELTVQNPIGVTVTVTDVVATPNVVVSSSSAHRRDGSVVASITLPRPGLYKIRVTGGLEPITQYVLAEDPGADE